MNKQNFGKYNDFFVSDKLDANGELEIRIPKHNSDFIGHSWLNRETAQKLVDHLNYVFKLGKQW